MSGIWPTPMGEHVLTACLATGDEARRAVNLLPQELEPASVRLAPLFYRRWPSSDHALAAVGQKAYLTLWRQNRERLDRLTALLEGLRERAIPCLVLKGAALVLRHYRDLGVRGMRDFDVLVEERNLEPAIGQLHAMGYVAEQGLSTTAVLQRVRVGHAWQFSLSSGESCDLHWRPVVRCYSPEVTRLFWEGAETLTEGAYPFAVPSPTDQLFHICAHGLQWDWDSQIRWIADAMTVMREPIDWDRLCHLAEEARMQVRLAHALTYLRSHLAACVPDGVLARLEAGAPGWQRREYRLLLKTCPLGLLDSVSWHSHHFRRVRLFDATWRNTSAGVAFLQYLRAFLGTANTAELVGMLGRELKVRLIRNGRQPGTNPPAEPA